MIRARHDLSLCLLLTVVLLGAAACEKPPEDMVLVPAGTFKMGTDQEDTDQKAMAAGFPRPWYEDEHPLQELWLPAFYIDRYELTNEKYSRFVHAVSHHPPEDWVNGTFPVEKGRFPVVLVNWYDANDYCKWAGKRLPTEAEWEKAARGPDGLLYPWGNTFDPKRAHIATESVMLDLPVPVGSYENGKSPYGAYDMIGNVWEWTDSWYQPYRGNTADNPQFGQKLRVTRGLSFMSVGHFESGDYQDVSSIVARASFRSFDYPSSRLSDVGFRCAKTK
jgi:formylglycine-generating enzyme required for sulfatase activity